MERIPEKDLLKIGVLLEDYHKVFEKFWSLSNHYFVGDDIVPTAAVRFSKDTKDAELLINKNFWLSKNLREKLFIVCHECLHVLLDHGVRNGMTIKGATHRLVNVAQDITINEMIVDIFGFDRNDLRGWENFCWIDTCFKDPSKISRNETFVYYLYQLIANPEKQKDKELFDDHETNAGGSSGQGESLDFDQEIQDKLREEFAKTITKDLDPATLNKIKAALPSIGNQPGTFESYIDSLFLKEKVKQKLNIKQLIKKLKSNAIKKDVIEVDTFASTSRRFNDVLITNRDLSLPGQNEQTKNKKSKLVTAIFMDVSGSCYSYLKYFNSIANSFEKEKHIFDINLYVFDMIVKKVQLGQNVRAGGGTAFDIIEQELLKLEKYPDCVIIITDGYGNQVSPKHADRWIWLLTPNPNVLLINKKSKQALLSDVVVLS